MWDDKKPGMSEGRRVYRIKEAVATYRLSRSTIYKMIAAGTLRTVKVGGCRLIPRDALEALIAAEFPERV